MLRHDLLEESDILFLDITFGCVLFLRSPFAMSNATVLFSVSSCSLVSLCFVDRMYDKRFDRGWTMCNRGDPCGTEK